MKKLNSINLIEQYKKLRQKELQGISDKEDALNMIVICIELGKRGFKLSEDERSWLKPVISSDKKER